MLSNFRRIIFPIGLGFALFFGLSFYYNPIFWYEAFSQRRLRLHNVQFKSTQSLEYLEKKQCVDEQCQCLLLIHGLGDFAYTWTSFFTSKELSNTHLYAINLPGSSKSPHLSTQADYSLKSLSSLIQTQILDFCPSWTLVGNSYGGWISVKLAQEDKRIQNLVLLSPAGLKKDYQPILKFFIDPDIATAQDFYERAYAHPYPIPQFVFKALVRRSKKMPIRYFLEEVRPQDFIETPIAVQGRVLILWGEQDRVLPFEWSSDYQKLILNSDLEKLKGCGHAPQKECFTSVQNHLVKFLKLN